MTAAFMQLQRQLRSAENDIFRCLWTARSFEQGYSFFAHSLGMGGHVPFFDHLPTGQLPLSFCVRIAAPLLIVGSSSVCLDAATSSVKNLHYAASLRRG